MKSLTAIVAKRLRRLRFTPMFSGTWKDRLSDVFDCEVDYTGKTILDAGCNMGIIAYEISKRRPRFIHGIDRYRRAVAVARRIFLAVDVEHRFDVVNILDRRRVTAILRPDYDIVLLLAVWPHLLRADRVRAEEFVSLIAGVCREAIVFRGPDEFGEQFAKLVIPLDFHLAFNGERKTEQAGRILVFRRSRPGSPDQVHASARLEAAAGAQR